MDEIRAFNSIDGNKRHATGRPITRQAIYPGMSPGIADATDFKLSMADQAALMKLMAVRENTLEGMRIKDLSQEFFMTNSWFLFGVLPGLSCPTHVDLFQTQK
jgi:myosin-crossreactive antigen